MTRLYSVFNWLLALSGLSTIFTWLSINIAHIRFRAAWKAQGHTYVHWHFCLCLEQN